MPRKHQKKTVNIQAQTVTVKPNKGGANHRRRVNGNSKPRPPIPTPRNQPRGIQTAMSGLAGGVSQSDGGLGEQASAFVRQYCDPCGEHTCSLDAARVPDGALQTSVGGFFRGVTTIVFPWQFNGSVDLTGKTYSMLLLQLPLLRNMCIVIANENDGEFDEVLMTRFATIFGSTDSASATYPSWVSLNDPARLSYYTLIDTNTLRNIIPPGANGVSGTIDSYRFGGQGLNMMFNTPDLIDQGTIASMRYPLNFDTKVLQVETPLLSSDLSYLRSTARYVTTDPPLWTYTIRPADPIDVSLPSFSGNPSSLPSPNFTATIGYRNAAGSFTVIAGNFLRYEFNLAGIRLVNLANGQFLTVAPVGIGQNGDIVEQSFRLYQTSSGTGPFPEEYDDAEFSIIALPPVTQADMLQQNPKVSIELAKETGGVYLPGCIFQPVFNVTHSTSYRKIVLSTKSLDLVTVSDPVQGWYDTFDTNFGINVVNMQGFPYACKPLLKLCRTVEFVPSANSLLGAFATGAPPAEPEAVDVCKAFTDAQPHGYPSDYNGLGILFGKIMGVVKRIPRLMRSGRNLTRGIHDICEAQYDTSDDEEVLPLPRKRTQKRLRRIR
jgi:hypothetical protein